MKNQYFGDISDYHKYGLLRALLSQGLSSLLVAWMLTPDDQSRDGTRRSYLEDLRYPDLDAPLFQALAQFAHSHPQVSLIERSDVLPNTTYYSKEVPDDLPDRMTWRRGLIDAARGAEMVFLDPDNGIEVPSKRIGHKGSSKYLAWEEIGELWGQGSSLIIYQHYCRASRDEFERGLVSKIGDRIKSSSIETLGTPYVLFLMAAQQRHQEAFRKALSIMKKWPRCSKR